VAGSTGTGDGELRWVHGDFHLADSGSVFTAVAKGVWCQPLLQKVCLSVHSIRTLGIATLNV